MLRRRSRSRAGAPVRLKDTRLLKAIGSPNGAPAHELIGELVFSSVKELQDPLAKNGSEIIGDIPNFTDVSLRSSPMSYCDPRHTSAPVGDYYDEPELEVSFKGQGRKIMQNKAPRFKPKRAASKLKHKIAGFVIVFVWTCITPAVFAQQDVHAALISSANRKPAPAFQLVTNSGGRIRISDYRGKVVLLNFWATECGGCVLEIPSFIDIEKGYKDKGFTAIGVSMDVMYEDLKDANEAWRRVRPFMAKRGINYTIAMGDDAISKAYELNAFPATYLIEKSGRIAVSYVGMVINKDGVVTNIKKLLSEQ